MSRVLVVGAVAPSPRALALADLVELRLDLGAEAHAAALRAAGARCLVTVRGAREGGAFTGPPAEAAAWIAAVADAVDAPWVDAERDVVAPLRARLRPGRAILASRHGTGPVDLPREGVAAWKVARPVDDGPALAAALDEARARARACLLGEAPPTTVVPYGAAAAARVVTAAAALGAGVDPFVFGRDGADPSPALAGVPVLAHLVDEGRLGEGSGGARVFGLVGRPARRSPSPRLHAAVFRAFGLDAVYLPAVAIDPARPFTWPFAGFSVTTPWKEDVAARCDVLDALARRVGAVNTVFRDAAGRTVGSNTDALAVRAALAAHGVAGGGAFVLGGGGFARAAAAALAEAGCAVRLAGGARAAAAAAALAVAWAGPEGAPRGGDRVVVNATPLGGDGALPPALAALLAATGPGALVVDAPYAEGGGPAGLACAAAERGLAVVDGGALLVGQARAQAEAFTGRPVPAGVLEDALEAGPTIVLVGPRGAGKTSVGRAVARRLGRPFVDTDDALARAAARPAGRLLALEGEPAFRARERAAARAALARRGAVVALGGGALTSPEVAAAVRDGAFVVRLEVGPETAAARVAADPAPRPALLPGTDPVEEARRVGAARAPLYAAAADVTVAGEPGTVDEVAAAVVAAVAEARSRRVRLD
ncbi:MAG: shikimate kinase [Planctomycetota bacterium]